jgi:hypothetical protein
LFQENLQEQNFTKRPKTAFEYILMSFILSNLKSKCCNNYS